MCVGVGSEGNREPCSSPSIFLIQGLLYDLTRLTGPGASGHPPVSAFHLSAGALWIQTLVLYVAFGDLNSDPHTCMTKAFTD